EAKHNAEREFLFDFYVGLAALEERIAGREQPFEGIRIVRVRKDPAIDVPANPSSFRKEHILDTLMDPARYNKAGIYQTFTHEVHSHDDEDNQTQDRS